MSIFVFFFFSSRRRHTRWTGDWSSDVCSSDLRLCRFYVPQSLASPQSRGDSPRLRPLRLRRKLFGGKEERLLRAGRVGTVRTRHRPDPGDQIGRASCRERVEIAEVADTLEKTR